MLRPRRIKFQKPHLIKPRGLASRGNRLVFGNLGLQATKSAYLTAQQIEAARRTITRSVKRIGKLWVRSYPDRPVTKRSAESRMGAGKGSPEYWVAVTKPGTILFELAGVPKELGYTALKNASYKLPMKTKILDLEN